MTVIVLSALLCTRNAADGGTVYGVESLGRAARFPLGCLHESTKTVRRHSTMETPRIFVQEAVNFI